MGIIEELASLRASVEALTRSVGRHSRVPEQRWATVTTCTASDLRVTFPGTSGEAIITRSTEACWMGAQVLVQVQGNDRWIIGLGGGSVPAGFTGYFAGPVVPAGWMLRDGSLVSRATYWRLYAALGGAASPHGQGDGSTTFGLPNALGRVTLGTGTATGAAGATAHTLGQKGGEETHSLTSDENGRHSHDLGGGQTFGMNFGSNAGGSATFALHVDAVNTGTYQGNYYALLNGLGTAHNTLPPYIAEQPIIKF